MAYFTHIKDETKPHNKIVEVVPNGIRLVDFLKKQELVNPQIFLNGNLLFSEDGEVLIDIDDNYRLKEDDNLLVVNTLKGASILVSAVATILVSSVVSYAISALLAPDKPSIPNIQSAKQQKGESEYSISTSQNMAKKGEPIPECFGEFVRYPDLISAPYYRYHNNEEYLYMLMCVTKGNVDMLTPRHYSYEINSSANDKQVKNKLFFVEDTPFETIGQDKTIAFKFNSQDVQNNIDPTYYSPISKIPLLNGNPYQDLVLRNGERNLLTNFATTLGGSTIIAVNDTIQVIELDLSIKFKTLASGVPAGQEDYSYGIRWHFFDDANNLVLSQHEIYGRAKLDEYFNFKAYCYLSSPTPLTTVIFTAYAADAINPPDGNPNPDNMEFAANWDWYVNYVTVYDTWEFDTNIYDFAITAKEIENVEIKKDKNMSAISLNRENEAISRIEFDINFPNGLYSQDSGGNKINRTVEANLNIAGIDTNGNRQTYQQLESFTNNTASPYRKTITIDVTEGYYDVWMERVTPDTTSARIQDTLYLTRVKGFVNNSDLSQVDYNNDSTYCMARIKASNAISSKGQFKIKLKGQRENLQTLNSCIEHIYTTENGGRQDPQNLDLPSMPESFNHVFEKRGTVYQAMNTVARSGNYNLYPSFNSITAKKDEAQPIPAFMFNESNIIKGTLKISKTVRAETDYDGMKGIYKDADTFEEKTIVFPETAIFPQELPLDGVTDDAIALDRVKFAWYQGIYRNTKYEFDTTLVGHIPSLFSRCQIAHNNISNSIPNQLIGYTTNTVTLRDTIKTDGTYTHIVFRDRQGAPSALFEILSINENVLTLDVSTQALPVADFYIGDDEIKTMCQVGTSATFIKDIMLTEIKPKRGNKISIKAFNYDERVYQ